MQINLDRSFTTRSSEWRPRRDPPLRAMSTFRPALRCPSNSHATLPQLTSETTSAALLGIQGQNEVNAHADMLHPTLRGLLKKRERLRQLRSMNSTLRTMTNVTREVLDPSHR